MNPPRGQGNGQVLALTRLADDSDIGLAGARIAAKVIPSEIVNRVELWIVLTLAQPSPLADGAYVEEIPYRMIGTVDVPELIKAFQDMRAARAVVPSLVLA